MWKRQMPSMTKPHAGSHAPRIAPVRGGHTAFPAGGSRAFNDPATMAAPDQAFGAAMAQPQGGAASLPMPPAEG